MTHGFDSIGYELDGEGNHKNWWKNETKQIFKEKFQCLINQYNNFSDPISGLNLNGTETLSENIADNGKLRQEYFNCLTTTIFSFKSD